MHRQVFALQFMAFVRERPAAVIRDWMFSLEKCSQTSRWKLIKYRYNYNLKKTSMVVIELRQATRNSHSNVNHEIPACNREWHPADKVPRAHHEQTAHTSMRRTQNCNNSTVASQECCLQNMKQMGETAYILSWTHHFSHSSWSWSVMELLVCWHYDTSQHRVLHTRQATSLWRVCCNMCKTQQKLFARLPHDQERRINVSWTSALCPWHGWRCTMTHHGGPHVPQLLLLLILEVLCKKQQNNERSDCLQLTNSVQASFNVE